MRKYLIIIAFSLFLIPNCVFAENITLSQPYTNQQIFADGLAKTYYNYQADSISDTYGGSPVWRMPPNYDFDTRGNALSIYSAIGESWYAHSTFNAFSWNDYSKYCTNTSMMNITYTFHSTRDFFDTYGSLTTAWFYNNSRYFACTTYIQNSGTFKVTCQNVPTFSSGTAQIRLDYSIANTTSLFTQNLSIEKTAQLECINSSGDIIGNANQNKNDIINNQNQNKNEIIDNQNKNQSQTNEKLDGINDSITDPSVPDVNTAFDGISSAEDQVSDLVLLPINVLRKYVDFTEKTCTPYSIPFGLFGSDYTLTLPCINLESYLGSALWGTIDTLCCFFFIYEFIMLVINAFDSITSLKDTYDSLYQPKHGPTEYQPKHGGD